MKFRTPFSNPRSFLAILATVAVAAGSGTADAAPPFDEAPARVATQGLAAEEHLAQRAELARTLARELPAVARQQALRMELTAAEAAAIDGAPRGELPLKIGLVKPLAPALAIDGLDTGSSAGPRRAGVRGQATATADGGAVWAAVLETRGAGGVRIHLEGLSLPRNAELFFYSLDGQAHGPYRGAGSDGSGEQWTGTIFGPQAILQVRLAGSASPAALAAVSLRATEVGLVTERFVSGLRPPHREPAAPPAPGWPCGNESCLEDATCYGGIADTLSLAVAKIEWIQGAYIYTCTGGLVSDNNPTLGNFFLTANHCISKNNSAKNANFYWRFATSSCGASSCPTNAGWPYQTSGASVAKTNRKGDYSLLRLSSAPPAGSVFLGWTSAPVANTNGTDLFRVSNPNFGPQVYSQHDVDTSAPTCTSWPRGERIYSRDTLGAIDGGSSGSPVVNGAAQIVGQLSGSCGFNPSQVCSSGPGEDNATVDGAFAFYYPAVQPLLNP